MKKLMWPLMVGIQMVKLTLFAIFLPSIIGSVGKIVSKGKPSKSSINVVIQTNYYRSNTSFWFFKSWSTTCG